MHNDMRMIERTLWEVAKKRVQSTEQRAECSEETAGENALSMVIMQDNELPESRAPLQRQRRTADRLRPGCCHHCGKNKNKRATEPPLHARPAVPDPHRAVGGGGSIQTCMSTPRVHSESPYPHTARRPQGA